jgi:hypothetical protein
VLRLLSKKPSHTAVYVRANFARSPSVERGPIVVFGDVCREIRPAWAAASV